MLLLLVAYWLGFVIIMLSVGANQGELGETGARVTCVNLVELDHLAIRLHVMFPKDALDNVTHSKGSRKCLVPTASNKLLILTDINL